jgi:6-phosphogluconolactonase
MNRDMRWSRRAFLQGIGCASAASALCKVVRSNDLLSSRSEETLPKGFAYVGSINDAGATGIHVFEICGDYWNCRQSVPSQSPISLALHPSQRYLYAANDVDEHERLPRGTVEAYEIADNGNLTLINRQPLSLSGTRPRHIAISPDGKNLVVAIHGGGAYNVLPIAHDGSVGRLAQILKDVGAGSHPYYQKSAHPHTVAFDKTGQHVLATDEGCDRLSVFTFQNGRMMRTQQIHSRSGSGLGHFALHPGGNFLYLSNTVDGSIDCYCWLANRREVKYERRVATNLKSTPWEANQLIISESGRSLFVVSGHESILVWEINPETGELSLRQQWSVKNSSLQILTISPDKRRLLVADSRQHILLSIPIHAEIGELGVARAVAKIGMARTLIVKYI